MTVQFRVVKNLGTYSLVHIAVPQCIGTGSDHPDNSLWVGLGVLTIDNEILEIMEKVGISGLFTTDLKPKLVSNA